ncbi:MAG: D-alanyl-D-alanine carboxypeptidase/D-alanyl-D-alanine-endopeptidase, partial [Prolixibacteraceae bacterium]|nr:D-alanyl-D-alanine carboxypeptidase/D-alanyl-D-alanine-endopeptidase [Prolixibacteraceae bacterium]
PFTKLFIKYWYMYRQILNNKPIINCIALLLLAAGPLAGLAQPAPGISLQNFLDDPHYINASAGLHIADQESGKTLFGYNEETLLIPASVLKIVSSAAALEILGPDYRFSTGIGFAGAVNDGVLKGDIVIKGGGDPALGSEYFTDHYGSNDFLKVWVRQLRLYGISRVTGNIIVDLSVYDREKIPPKWTWEDIGNYYGAAASALTIYDNMFRISFRSPRNENQATEIISVYPRIGGLELDNRVISSGLNRDLAYVFGSPFDLKRVINGSVPAGRSSFTIKASNPFPEKLLASHFADHLAAEGIFLSGNVKITEETPENFKVLYIQYSPPLSEIVKVMNMESVNLFAEHLVKQVSVLKTGTGSRESGLEQISEFWMQKDLKVSQLIMEDGSGLSHFNAVSPSFLTSVLSYMYKSGSNNSFINSLPRAGEGTAGRFSRDIFPGESLRIKSGSMTRVRCYAGYLEADSGRRLAFAFMINHYSGPDSKLTDEVVKLINSWKVHF